MEYAHAVGEELGLGGSVVASAGVELGLEGDDDIAEVSRGHFGLKLATDQAQWLDVVTREVRDDFVEDFDGDLSHWPGGMRRCAERHWLGRAF